MKGARFASRAVLALAGTVLVFIGWMVWFAPPRWSVLLLTGDDAGYYFNIARNICLGYGPSFDRVHPTNGFNPLETLLLVGADRLLAPGLGVPACYRVGLLVSYAALLLGLAFFVRLMRRALDERVFQGEGRRLAVASGVAFYVFFIVPKKQFGMDAALVLTIGGWTLDRIMRGGLLAPSGRAALADGVLLGLLALARVDNLSFLAAAFAVMALLAAREPARWKGLALRVLSAALLVLPYGIWSLRTFGDWLPVSARIKSSFPHPDLGQSLAIIRHSSVNAADQLSFAFAFLAAWTFAVVALREALGGRLGERLRDPRFATLAVLSLYLIARLGFMLLFSRTDVQGGYVVLAHVFNVLVLFGAAEWLAKRSPARAETIVTATAAALVLGSLLMLAGKAAGQWERVRDRGTEDEWALAGRLREATGPRDVLYGGAFGLMGFFSDRAWINGDGVANTYDYQRAFLEPDGLRAWLESSGVTHVVFAAPAIGIEPGERIRLDVRGVLAQRVRTIEIDPRDIVLEGRLARGFDRAHPGSVIVLARYARR